MDVEEVRFLTSESLENTVGLTSFRDNLSTVESLAEREYGNTSRVESSPNRRVVQQRVLSPSRRTDVWTRA
ncbi:hypothetical protein J6590_071108 [Homalodisca vitripennis]|nr:hypothetical protein J6590_071108 [Homalodisca vitripennis]